jgi:hypothetical protein
MAELVTNPANQIAVRGKRPRRRKTAGFVNEWAGLVITARRGGS